MRPVSSHPRGIFGGGGGSDSVVARSVPLSLPFSAVKGADDDDDDDEEDANADADAEPL